MVEVCRFCHFLWFDQGELEALPRKPIERETNPRQMPVEARVAIAKHKALEYAKEKRGKSFGSRMAPPQAWKIIPGVLQLPVEFDNRGRERAPVITWLLSAVIFVISLYGFQNPDLSFNGATRPRCTGIRGERRQ